MPENEILNKSEPDDLDNIGVNESLSGLLVNYTDDQLNDCVNSALKRKSRVKYKCMDVQIDHLGFGTSGGAIYLFRLGSFNHSPCSLESMIPCDQGSVEAIRFLPNNENDDILIAIGTSRGSLVIFRVTRIASERGLVYNEIYRAESFTNNIPVKMIEFDQNYMDPQYSFDRLYICDQSCRIYALDQSSFSMNKQTPWRFYVKQQPNLIIGISNSKVNQISVYKSLILISTDSNSKLFYDQTCGLHTIGTKRRKEGFYGACFFNSRQRGGSRYQDDRPISQFSSTNSLTDPENLVMFVARPMFRLWQVNHERAVQFTHQFEPLIKQRFIKPIELSNEIMNDPAQDDPSKMIECLRSSSWNGEEDVVVDFPKVDHFQKLIPISTLTLGDLLLSYTQHEIFIIDPIKAELIMWTSQEEPIIHVSCNENELFIWSQSIKDWNSGKENNIRRLVLFAPTQLILELHRMHRYLSLIWFVQMYSKLFRDLMALPLTGASVITKEGGLLRNVLLNAWDTYKTYGDKKKNLEETGQMSVCLDGQCDDFKEIVEEIVNESKQLKKSFNDFSDSTMFLKMKNENVERICSEPYASLVSLQVSIAELHTNHVIHFDQDTINRHRSIASLSQNISNLQEAKQSKTRSNADLIGGAANYTESSAPRATFNGQGELSKDKPTKLAQEAKVIVERQRPKPRQRKTSAESVERRISLSVGRPYFSAREAAENKGLSQVVGAKLEPNIIEPEASVVISNSEPMFNLSVSSYINGNSMFRCSRCQWPRDRIHCNSLSSSQSIQLRWIEENLMSDFAKNLEQIERRSFEHGLWHLYLRCLTERDQLDEFVICCIMLDDVRLLKFDPFIKEDRGDEEISECFLDKLEQKLELERRFEKLRENKIERRFICLKCNDLFGLPNDNDNSTNGNSTRKKRENSNTNTNGNGNGNNDNDNIDTVRMEEEEEEGGGREEGEEQEQEETVEEDAIQIDDEISFNLVNLFEQVLIKRFGDPKRIIGNLLRHPELLNGSKIPSSFYLRTMANATLIAKIENQQRFRE